MDNYVYIYKDPSRDYYGKPEPIYVGKGSGYRARKHLRRTDHCEFVHRLQKMKQNGIEPIIEKIIVGANWQFALGIETMLIKRIGRKDLGTGPLLNLTNGGENPPLYFGWTGKNPPGSFKPGDQSGEKNTMFGKHHSDESNEKNRKSHLGENNSNFGKRWKQEIVTCPHCGKSGGISGMKHYHFENCKYNGN